MNHNLIDRVQNYTLDRKILSIDTDDRDISKYPNPSEFEISCPQIYTNVESIRILNINFTNKIYNISEYLQNNKFYISINNTSHLITIQDGIYTPTLIQNTLQNLLIQYSSTFIVQFNDVNNKIYFSDTSKPFTINFLIDISYNNFYNFNCNNYNKIINNNIYQQQNKWGLGFLLGFDKLLYTSSPINNYNAFSYNNPLLSWTNYTTNTIISPHTVNLEINQNIYIEIDKLNQSDEIKPYTIDKYTNTNNGIVNSFIAKIPIFRNYNQQIFITKDFFLESVSYYQPPLEKISKLKFKFRFHNGLLVDLQNNNISFTLEINQIRNEIKDYKVRTPFTIHN